MPESIIDEWLIRLVAVDRDDAARRQRIADAALIDHAKAGEIGPAPETPTDK